MNTSPLATSANIRVIPTLLHVVKKGGMGLLSVAAVFVAPVSGMLASYLWALVRKMCSVNEGRICHCSSFPVYMLFDQGAYLPLSGHSPRSFQNAVNSCRQAVRSPMNVKKRSRSPCGTMGSNGKEKVSIT